MSLMDFLQELERHSISISCEGDALKIAAPKGALTDGIRSSLVLYKQDILNWLRQSAATETVAWPVCVPDSASWHKPYPLSDLQRGFYMAADSFMEFHVRPHYYIEKNMRDMDVSRYEAAWNKALRRHRGEIVVVREDGNLQVLENPEPLHCRVMDLRGMDAASVLAALSQTRESMMRSELPLDRWPWVDLRFSIWSSDGVEYGRVHYNHNNFFADGGGTSRFLQEVDRYYKEPGLNLPPLSLGVRDAVLTLEGLAESASGQADRHYWEARLPGLPGPPQLPMRSGMERRVRSRLNRREMFMEASLWLGFKENARHYGLTPSVAVFAVYAEVLGQWSNQRHFVLSNMVTRRLPVHPEIFEILGNFASLYPLEIHLRKGEGFVAHARAIQQQVTRDTQHLRWGGMRVMQALNQLLGGFGRAPIPFVVGSGLFMEGFERSDFSCLETSQVMLDHQFWELSDGRYYYVWDVLEEFFPDGMLDAMLGAYHDLLERLSTDQSLWLSESFAVVPLRHMQDEQAVAPEPVAISDCRLNDFLSRSAVVCAGQAALEMSQGCLDYAELEQRASRLAQVLINVGIGRGDVVAVVTDRGPALLQAVHAIHKAGAAYVPVDPSLPEDRRHYMLENSSARLVLTEERYFAQLAWPDGMQKIRIEDDFPNVPGVVSVAGDVTDLAYLIYTSGSTGRPKAVMIDHRGAVNTVLDINKRFAVNSADRILGVSAFGFDLSVYDIFGAAAAGAALVYPEPEYALNPAHWLDLLFEQRVTIWNSAPPLARLMVEAAEFRAAQLPSLRLVLLSGDWIPVDLPDRIRTIAPAARVVSLGGATEASIWSIIYEINKVDPAWVSIPYGYPMLNQSWYILNDWGQPAPEWCVGDLYIGGVGLALGYWGDAEKTARSFVAHPLTGKRIYRTGDLGRYLPGGVIEFLGRSDFQVKIQGHRIELGEIESVLSGCEQVLSSVVTVQKNAQGMNAQLAAYVVAAADAVLDMENLRQVLARRLPDYMVPRLWMQLERLPLSSNGKIDRKMLPVIEDVVSVVAKSVARRAPQGETELKLHAIWCKALALADIAANDDFFELGGQSFEAVRIIGMIRECFGVALSLADIWQQRTICALAKRLQSDQGGKLRVLVSIDSEGVGTPCFLVHPAGGNVLCYGNLGSRLSRPVYALQAPGIDGLSTPLQSIEAFAECYLPYIEEMQPEGAVWLGGWSSGGLIAYELAVQLRARGRAVAGVVILDSPAPLLHTTVSAAQMLDWFFGDLNLPQDVYRILVCAEASVMDEEEYLREAARKMYAHGIGLGADVAQLLAVYRVFRGIVHASRRYYASSTDVDILHVRAEQGIVSEFANHPNAIDADWGWRQFGRGRVEGVFMQATHYTLLNEPALTQVLHELERWMKHSRELN